MTTPDQPEHDAPNEGEQPMDGDAVVLGAGKIKSACDAALSEQLMSLVATLQRHPDMFDLQATLLAKRLKALMHAGFTRREALELLKVFGLKKDLVS